MPHFTCFSNATPTRGLLRSACTARAHATSALAAKIARSRNIASEAARSMGCVVTQHASATLAGWAPTAPFLRHAPRTAREEACACRGLAFASPRLLAKGASSSFGVQRNVQDMVNAAKANASARRDGQVPTALHRSLAPISALAKACAPEAAASATQATVGSTATSASLARGCAAPTASASRESACAPLASVVVTAA